MTVKDGRLLPRMYFSCIQFLVYDSSNEARTVSWEGTRPDQCFARQDSKAAFRTLLGYGEADVTWHLGPYRPDALYERVIAVPFKGISGTVGVCGAEEYEIDRLIDISPGDYRLVAAQRVLSEDNGAGEMTIDLFFERQATPLSRSEVLVSDPFCPVLETYLEFCEGP